MEADWEIEIGPDAPVIDALWSDFADLRIDPARASGLEEVRKFPALADILIRLNGWISPNRRVESSFWTSKCDLWTPESVDPYELDASPAESAAALACYIDLIPSDPGLAASLKELESSSRTIVTRLQAIPRRCCRVDLVLRRAMLGEKEAFGITAYITACGPSPDATGQALHAALLGLVEAISTSVPS